MNHSQRTWKMLFHLLEQAITRAQCRCVDTPEYRRDKVLGFCVRCKLVREANDLKNSGAQAP